MKFGEGDYQQECEEMVRRISEATEQFPKPHLGYDFWHFHLPILPEFIDSPNTPSDIRKLCVQTLLARAHHLASIAPRNEMPTRIVVAVSLPKLASSQIIVFFGSEYFKSFFTRDRPGQVWTPLEEKRSLAREWEIQIPPGFIERGIRQEITETDFRYDGEIWFIGQLTAVNVHERQRHWQ
jgi:hypothetical protein